MSQKVKNCIRSLKYPAALFGLSFAVVLVFFLASIQAQCTTGWDASGNLGIMQDGQEDPIEVTLQQNGRVLTGKAQAVFTRIRGFHTQIDQVTALVDGTIDGDSISIQLYWSNSSPLLGNNKIGVYNATIRPSGRLEGEAYEKRSPNVRLAWHSQNFIKCLPLPVAPKPPKSTGKAKPVKSTGKAKPESSSDKKEEPAPRPLEPPAIVAGKVIYPNANLPMGVVILTWDAGSDHPYAEVWFKVNNGEDTFLVEQGKGSRQVPVEKGKFYSFILTDAGKTLANVVVTAF